MPQPREDPRDLHETAIDALAPTRVEPGGAAPVGNMFGKYEVLDLLGRGGQGAVYRVRNPALGRIEVLKVLHTFGDSSDAQRRFEREARAVAQLRHRNILPLYEVGAIDGRPYYTMEHVSGESLAQLLARAAPLAVRLAARIGRDAARGLAAAHQSGVVHRDVKPANILIAADEEGAATSSGERDLARLLSRSQSALRVVVVDFGLARVSGEESLTGASVAILGTAPYMAPEQILGEVRRIDARSDVWSLGVTLYYALTGRLPFSGSTLLELQRRIPNDEPPPPSRFRRGLPRDLDAIVGKCLEKDPDRRYPGAAELAEDLERHLAGELVQARPAGLARRAMGWARRHKLAVGSVAATCLATSALVFFLVVLPELRAALADRNILDEVATERRRLEAEFEALVESGRYDEAIELAKGRHGTLPEFEKLDDPERALAREEVSSPYRFDLARAHLLRAERRTRAGKDAASSDLAAAYRYALEDEDSQTGCRALLGLGRFLEEKARHESALAIYRLAETRFGTTPEVQAGIARTLERTGELEEALSVWRRLSRVESHRTTAGEALDLLERLVPRRRFSIPLGTSNAGDVDGDGRAEFIHNDPRGVFTIYRLDEDDGLLEMSSADVAEHWIPGLVSRVYVVDAFEDEPGPEILAPVVDPNRRIGKLLVLGLRSGELRLLAHFPVTSQVHDACVADLDRDGRREIVLALGYRERGLLVLGSRGRRLTSATFHPLPGDALLVEPIGPEAQHRLLVQIGPWDQAEGFRTAVYELGPDGRLRRVAASPRANLIESWVRLAGGEFIAAVAMKSEYGDREFLESLVPPGLHRFRAGPEGIGELQPLAGAPPPDPLRIGLAPRRYLLSRLRTGDGERVLYTHGPDLHFHDPGRGTTRSIALGKEWVTRVFDVADVDGDGDQELVSNQGQNVVDVWGLGDPGEVATSTSNGSTIAALPEGTVGDDLRAAGLHTEAADFYESELERRPDDQRMRFGLAIARAGEGRHEEAGRLLEIVRREAREPWLAVDARVALARSQQARRDWKALAGTLRELDATLGVDPYTVSQVSRWRAWAEPAAALDQREIHDDWTRPNLPFVCENPFQFQREGAPALAYLDPSARPSAGGLAFRYRGGPLRLRLRYRIDELPHETSVQIGFETLERLGHDWGTETVLGPRLTMTAWSTGARTHYLRWEGSPRVNQGYRLEVPLPSPEFQVAPASYILELEYVPGLDRGLVRLRSDHGVDWSDDHEIPFRIEPGVYVVGFHKFRPRGTLLGGQTSSARLLSVEIDTADDGSQTERLDRDQSARARLLQASGDLVLGDPVRALQGFEDAIRLASVQGDWHTLWRARLFRALASKDPLGPEAADHLRRAIETPQQQVVTLLHHACQLAPAEVRQAYLAFVPQAHLDAAIAQLRERQRDRARGQVLAALRADPDRILERLQALDAPESGALRSIVLFAFALGQLRADRIEECAAYLARGERSEILTELEAPAWELADSERARLRELLDR